MVHEPVHSNFSEFEAIETFNLEARSLLGSDLDKALEVAQNALHRVEGLGYELGQAHSLWILGEVHYRKGNLEQAKDNLAQAAEIFFQKRETSSELGCKVSLGKAFRDLGLFAAAQQEFERALELANALNQSSSKADALNGLASLYMMAFGDLRRAIEALTEVRQIRQIHQDRQGEVAALNNLAILHTELSEYPPALEYLFESLGIIKSSFVGTQLHANCLINLGTVHSSLKDFPAAQACFNQSLEISRGLDDRVSEIISLINLGELNQEVGNYVDAIGFFQTTLQLAQASDLAQGEMDALAGLGQAQSSQGYYAEALQSFDHSWQIARKIGQKRGMLVAIVGTAKTLRALGKPVQAENVLLQALELSTELEQRKISCEVHHQLAEVYEGSGKFQLSLKHLKEFHRLERAIFSEEGEKHTKNLILGFELEQAKAESEVYRLRTQAASLAQQEAERANKAKSDFLSRMSHELRTPLNAILGFAQLLDTEALGKHDRQGVEQIIKAGNHLLGLINEVLDVARIEAGRLDLSLEPIEISKEVQQIVDLMQPLAAQRKVSLVIGEDSCKGLYIGADQQRLKQVLLNLISNATKYNQLGGQVTVHTHVRDRFIRISVSDTGLGIPQEKLGLLFNPFERLGTENSRIEGSGIGLALSKRLVEAMEGRIGVESIEGKGSTFWFELPQAELSSQKHQVSAQLEVIEPAKTVTLQGEYKILHIEEGLSNLKLIQMILSKKPGIKLLNAAQGSLGLELATEHQPHLILLDWHLPDMDVTSVIKKLRSHPTTAKTPIIVLSTDASSIQADQVVQAGANDYLIKPLDIKLFSLVLEEYLKASQRQGGSAC